MDIAESWDYEQPATASAAGPPGNGTEGGGPRHALGVVAPAVSLLAIILFSILGNAAVILAVLKTPRLREKTSSVLLVNLSVTDLVSATLVMPSTLVSLLAGRWLQGTAWCYFQCAVNYWCIIVSMLTLALISVDGYFAVLHPLHYPRLVTPRATRLALGYAWLQGLAFAAVPAAFRWVVYDSWEVVCAIDWDAHRRDGALAYVLVAFLACFLVPAAVMTYCYGRICRVAHQKAGPPHGQPEPSSLAANSSSSSPANGRRRRRRRAAAANETRVVKSLVLVVAVFFLCMTPFCVTKLIKIVTSTAALPPYLYLAASWFGYLSSATNPFIYAIFRRDFRRAFARTLLCRGRVSPGREQSPPTASEPRLPRTVIGGCPTASIGNADTDSPVEQQRTSAKVTDASLGDISTATLTEF